MRAVEYAELRPKRRELFDAGLSGMPSAAVVIEGRYSALFKLEHVSGAWLGDMRARLQVRDPEVQVVFADSRTFAEEWCYRFLAAALADSVGSDVAKSRDGHRTRVLDPFRPGRRSRRCIRTMSGYIDRDYGRETDAQAEELALDPVVPHLGFSLARRRTRFLVSRSIAGLPGRR
jgi:hypothetical protein